MAKHGANFAHWLRDKLMKHYHYFHANAVYVDSIVSRSGVTRHGLNFPKSSVDSAGIASVAPDRRPQMRSETGAFPIGAMSPDWNSAFKRAMSQANVMLFIFTEEFRDSSWCMKEWGQFHQENYRRRHQNSAPLRGIVLEFSAAGNTIGISESSVTRIPVKKTDGQRQGLAWDLNDFILSQPDLTRLLSTIGTLNHMS